MQALQRTRVGLMDGLLAGWLAGWIEWMRIDMADLAYGERKRTIIQWIWTALILDPRKMLSTCICNVHWAVQVLGRRAHKESKKIKFTGNPLNGLDEGPFMIFQTTTMTTAAPSRSSSIP